MRITSKGSALLVAGLVCLGTAASASASVTGDGEETVEASSQAEGGFDAVVKESSAVVLRVPINAKGEENTSAAEIRLINGSPSMSEQALVGAFDSAESMADVPVVDSEETVDVSTCGWNSYYGYGGWQPSYYYSSYQPTYYSYGSYYNYSYSQSYSYYGYNSYGYAGYRYYQYNRNQYYSYGSPYASRWGYGYGY